MLDGVGLFFGVWNIFWATENIFVMFIPNVHLFSIRPQQELSFDTNIAYYNVVLEAAFLVTANELTMEINVIIGMIAFMYILGTRRYTIVDTF